MHAAAWRRGAAAVRVENSTGAAAPRATERSGPPAVVPAAAAWAARARSPAEGKRSSGSLAIARATTASNAAGSPGRSAEGTGGGAERCAHNFASSPSRSNGTRPVSAKCRTPPRA